MEKDQFTDPVGDYEHGGAAYTIIRWGFEMLEAA